MKNVICICILLIGISIPSLVANQPAIESTSSELQYIEDTPAESLSEDTSSGFDWSLSFNIAMLLLSTFFGAKWLQAKGKFSELVNLGQSVVDAGKEIEQALKDNDLSEEEKKGIRERFKGVAENFRMFIQLKHKEANA